MPEYSRVQARRQRARRKPKSAFVVALGVAAILVLAVLSGGGIWLATRRPSTPTAPQTQLQPPAVSKPASTSKPPVAETSSTQSSDASAVALSAATVAAGDASAQAVRKAAVAFPGAPAISATMRSVNHLSPRHKYIALTLDDGYNFQPAMLALLKQYDAHCTTFLIGSWAASHKSDLRAMRDAGFEIANHTWSHPFLTKLSSSQIESQLTKTQRVITSVTGNQAPYLRPPFGATDSQVKAAAASLGYRIVMWDRTFGDSGRGATPKKLYDNVVNSDGGVQPGDVILCHWGSKPSYEALKKILPDLQAQGYQFVTVSELIADSKTPK
jgi:peptidoglycan-N-acetylglucosamine deacetylase